MWSSLRIASAHSSAPSAAKSKCVDARWMCSRRCVGVTARRKAGSVISSWMAAEKSEKARRPRRWRSARNAPSLSFPPRRLDVSSSLAPSGWACSKTTVVAPPAPCPIHCLAGSSFLVGLLPTLSSSQGAGAPRWCHGCLACERHLLHPEATCVALILSRAEGGVFLRGVFRGFSFLVRWMTSLMSSRSTILFLTPV